MKNTYILMIIQALLTLLLFFSEGYVKYTTLGLFLLVDLVIFIDLLLKKWSFEELLTFAAIFCSGIFLLFYVFMNSLITIIFGSVLMLLFLVIAMLELISNSKTCCAVKGERLQVPEAPTSYYDANYVYEDDSDNISQSLQHPEPVMRVKPELKHSDVKNKLVSKAVAYELGQEVQQLKNADHILKDLKIYNAEKELIKEAKELQNVQKQMTALKNAQKTTQAVKELKNEAKEMLEVQKQINEIKKIQELGKEANALKKAEKQVNTIRNVQELGKEAKALKKAEKQIDGLKKIQELGKEANALKKAETQVNTIRNVQELGKEAKALKKAEKQIKEMKFLDQQEKIVKQAKSIAKAQKEIDEMNKSTKKSMATKSAVKSVPTKVNKTEVVKVKTIRAKDESFYFATDNGNKFHEPGCLSIKKVPKNKLILYTSKKDAMKKGLQPCNVCIPN